MFPRTLTANRSVDEYDLSFHIDQLGPRTNGHDSLQILLEIDEDTPPCRELITEARISSGWNDLDLSDNTAQAVTRVACRKVYLPFALAAR